MKKLFIKLGMPGLLSMLFLLGGLLLGANTASAQSSKLTNPDPLSPIKIGANLQWLSSGDVIDALQAQIVGFENLLETSSPGNTLQIKMKLLVFEGIIASIESGLDVPSAAFHNYYEYAPAPFKDYQQIFGMSNNDWTELYNDMIALLTI